MRIPSYDIKQDEFINILTSMRCYKMEDHSTAQCDQEQTFKMCSECGSSSRVWRECTASEKKCINCEGSQSVLATRCPKRKELINKKRKADQSGESAGYSASLKKNISNQVEIIHPPTGNVTISGSTHTTILKSHAMHTS